MDERAKEAADKLNAVLSDLYESAGYDSPTEFVRQIESGEIEVHRLPGNCYALITWRNDILHVLTCAGSVEGSEAALFGIEKIARRENAKAIEGFARYGWRPLLERLGFDTGTKLVHFKKVLI